ncbi:MAG: hypothetical protein NTV00_01170 [Methylococcales bacterium]|nr:hypothetical protein [Methylococcales bacterium]
MLFVFSVFQYLKAGLLAVLVIGVLGVFFSVKQFILKLNCRYTLLKRLFSLTVIFFLAFFASWGADYWAWDEFSHWGTQVEYLLLNNNLHTDSKLLLFPEYIPGMSLWRYFGRSLLPSIGVSGSYFINAVLIFSYIYAVSYNRSIIKWLLTALVVFLGLLVFFQALVNSLVVDPIQSLVLLCGLKIVSDDNPDNFIYLLLVAVILVLTKHVGLIFSFFIAYYYVLFHFFSYKKPLLLVVKKASVVFLLALIFYIIWFCYVDYYAMSRSVIDTSKLWNGDVVSTFNQLLINFIGVLNSKFPHANFTKSPLSIDGVTLWFFTLVVFIFGFILACLPCKDRKASLINFFILLTVGFAYILFLTFVRASTPWGGDPYSFSRYWCVLLFSCFLLQVLAALNNSIFRITSIGLIFSFFCLIVSPPLSSFISFNKRPEILINNEYNEKAQLLKKYANADSTVWYINNEDIAMGYFIFKSKVMPLKVLDYSKGWELYLNGFLYKLDNIEKRVVLFSQNICEADYIFVDTMPPEFWSQYSVSFNKINGRVYKVQHNKICYAELVEQ